MNRKVRASRYLLTYIVGPHLPEWWGSVFAIGYGLIIASIGAEALHLNVLKGPVAQWFESVTTVYGLLIVLCGLLGLHALHKRVKAVRMFASVVSCFAMLWLCIYYFLLVPTPWQGVWVYFTHATLEALVFLRVRHDLTEYWS